MNNDNQSSLEQAASAARTVRGAIKTGRAVSAAAKGAALGGPYGAAAGLALTAGEHGKKLLAGIAVLLLLPVMFVLMLPGLIFGGLTSSGANGQPILNNSPAIIGHLDAIAAAIDEILNEGLTDAKERIAQDFAGTGGDNYEVAAPTCLSASIAPPGNRTGRQSPWTI